MSISKFEKMLKTNNVYFFDATEFEEITQHYLDIGKHSLAHKSLKLGFEQHPTSVALKLLKAELFIFENKIPDAIKLLNEVEALEPNNEEVFLQKALILSKKNKHHQAIKLLQKALKFVEDPVDVWSLIGMEYMYLDDYENARFNFAKCIDVDFQDYSSLYNIIYCFEMNEQHEEAIKFLNLYIERNPYSEVAWHQLGCQYFILNMFEEALASFDYAVIIDDSFVGAYLEKAKTLEELKRYEEAIENYAITLELDDPTAFCYLRIGECFENLGNVDNAIQYYKKAVNEDPLLDKGWILITDLYCKLKDYNKAMFHIDKAIQIDCSNPMYWRKNAEVNVNLGFYNEAIKAFKQCIDLGDVDIEIYITLSDLLLFSNKFQESLKILISAQKTYKGFAEIEYRLCGLLMMLNKKDDALNHLKDALAIDFEYHTMIKELYPSVFEKVEIKNMISNYEKAIS